MSGFTSVVIVGGSGGIGKHITNGFLEAKQWKVFLLVNAETLQDNKKKAQYDEFVSKGAQLIMGEVDKPETYQDKIKGLDVVVSALGGRALESQIPLFHAAKHAGIKLVLPSEYGFDSTKVTPTRAFANKVEILNELKKIGLNYMLIATGLFLEYMLYPMFKTDIANKQVALYGDRSTKISVISVSEFGSLLPYVVNDPTLINTAVCFSGDQTTSGHLADEFASLVGEGATITQYTAEELFEQMKAKANDHPFSAVVEEIIYSLALGDNYFENPVDPAKYGKKLTTVHEFVEGAKKKQ